VSQRFSSMMVLFDFLLKRIAPLQLCTRSAWLYTGVNDTTRLERGHRSDLDPKVLDTMMGKLSPDPISPDFIIPPTACVPICLDQSMQMKLLKELPTLDNIDIAVQQVGDQSRGVQIPSSGSSQGCRGIVCFRCRPREEEEVVP
jgi:hypothetical protein